MIFYNNPENLSPSEILTKMKSLGHHGPNCTKRFYVLYSYDVTEITKEQFIERFTSKF